MFEIYSKNDCSYCIKIKDLFKFHKLEYREINLSNGDATKDDIQTRVGTYKKINTVPQVFHNDAYVGGYLETVEYIAYDYHIE
jgi:thioredoxin reductase (NADPH)